MLTEDVKCYSVPFIYLDISWHGSYCLNNVVKLTKINAVTEPMQEPIWVTLPTHTKDFPPCCLKMDVIARRIKLWKPVNKVQLVTWKIDFFSYFSKENSYEDIKITYHQKFSYPSSFERWRAKKSGRQSVHCKNHTDGCQVAYHSYWLVGHKKGKKTSGRVCNCAQCDG